MPFKKKLASKETPRRKSVPRSEKYDRLSRSGKLAMPRPRNRNSTAR